MSALSRYAALLRPYRRTYLVGLVFLALTNGLNLLVPWLVKVAVDDLARGRGLPSGPPVAGLERPGDVLLALVIIGAVLAAARTGSRLAILGAGRTLSRDVRDRMFAGLVVAPPSFFSRFPTGELMSRAIGDVGVLQSVASAGILYLFNAVFMLGVAAPWLVALDPGLAGLVLAPFPILALLTWALAERVRTFTMEAQVAMADLTRAAQETIAGVEVVKAFVLERRQAERFAVSNDRFLDRSLREATMRSLIGALSNLTGGLGTTAILWVGGSRVADGRMSYGDLALFLSVLALVVRPIVLFGWIVGLVQRGLAALERVDAIVLAATPRPSAPDAHRGPVQGDVLVKGLTYRYPVAASEAQADGARPAPPASPARSASGRLKPAVVERRLALDDVALHAPPGGVIGLTGRIGSGKSTLLEALPGFLDVPDGSVRIDGVPLEGWDLAALRAGIGWVPQDGYVFSLTLAENVTLGRPDAAPVEVEHAVGVAELSRDLDQLERGLDTLVGERGVTLSGGQRQRLAIARAVLVRPHLLLLDDALSMVDAETASVVLGNLRRALPGTTLLVAAHRAATLLGTDEILVLEQGRVVERGSPAELLARPEGRFAALFERQRLQAALEAA